MTTSNEAAVEAASIAFHGAMDASFSIPADWHDEIRAALEAAAPFLRAEGWDVCAGAVEAATRLVAPDEITPMGARVINNAAAKNPYRFGGRK